MNVAGHLFVYLVAAIGFVVGSNSIGEEYAQRYHFLAGIITSILFATFAIQIIA